MSTPRHNAYLAALNGRDPQPLIAATAGRIKQLLQKFSPEQLQAKPAPDRWSVRELICHFADAEIAWAWRLRMALEQEHHVIQPWDQNPWASRYDAYTLEQARTMFEGLRAWNLALIGTLTPTDLARPVTHPEWGEWTLGTIVQMMAGHDQHHLKKLEERAGQSE